MKTLYTDADFAGAKKTMTKVVAVAVIMLAVTIALMCVGMTVRIVYIAVGVPIVGACAIFTWWTIKCMPWIRYNKFLKNMREGRHRDLECYFMDMADAVRVVDGVQIHDFNASLDEAGEDGRLFYWDDDKERPTIAKGAHIRVTSYGNFILGIEEI